MIACSLAVALATATPAAAAPAPVPSASSLAPASAPAPSAAVTTPPAPSATSPVAAGAASGAPATPVTFAYRFVPYAPKDPEAPRVFAVYLNDKILHAPGPIDIRIDTSPSVARVEEHTGKKSYAIPMTAPGRFVSYGMLPKVPFIAHGIEVKLVFVAFDATGRSTTVTVPFDLR